MKKSHLSVCPSCARHVRVDEPICPFCHARLPPSFREVTVPQPPATRLSRVALYALRAGALSVTTVASGGTVSLGCSDGDSGRGNPMSIIDASYGGPPPDASNLGVLYGFPAGGYDATSPVQVGCPDAEPDGVTCTVGSAQAQPLDASSPGVADAMPDRD